MNQAILEGLKKGLQADRKQDEAPFCIPRRPGQHVQVPVYALVEDSLLEAPLVEGDQD